MVSHSLRFHFFSFFSRMYSAPQTARGSGPASKAVLGTLLTWNLPSEAAGFGGMFGPVRI